MVDKKNYIRKGYRRGRWAGKLVMVRKPHFEAIEKWARKSGMSKALFYRNAFMRGALEIAKGLGLAEKYPDLED
jgi:hypothetical protein